MSNSDMDNREMVRMIVGLIIETTPTDMLERLARRISKYKLRFRSVGDGVFMAPEGSRIALAIQRELRWRQEERIDPGSILALPNKRGKQAKRGKRQR